MAEGGIGRPTHERGAARDPFGMERFQRDSMGHVWRSAGAAPPDEAKDQDKAQVASRLAQLVSLNAPPDIWIDLKDHAETAVDDALEALFAATEAVDGYDPARVLQAAFRLTATRDFYRDLDKSIVVGHSAMRRLSLKRLASGMAAADAAQETREERVMK